MRERCRHYNAWFIANGMYEWCWECGAIRRLRPDPDTNLYIVETRWTSPTGRNGKNPFPMKTLKRENRCTTIS